MPSCRVNTQNASCPASFLPSAFAPALGRLQDELVWSSFLRLQLRALAPAESADIARVDFAWKASCSHVAAGEGRAAVNTFYPSAVWQNSERSSQLTLEVLNQMAVPCGSDESRSIDSGPTFREVWLAVRFSPFRGNLLAIGTGQLTTQMLWASWQSFFGLMHRCKAWDTESIWGLC